MDPILPVLFILLFSYLVVRMPFFQKSGVPLTINIAFLWLKFIAGYLMYFIYTEYYTDRSTADIFKFFDDATVLYNAASDDPGSFLRLFFGVGGGDTDAIVSEMNHWSSRHNNEFYNAHAMIRWNTLVMFISQGNFHVHHLAMSFMSFAGLIALFKVVSRRLEHGKGIYLLLLALLPSLWFWGSGPLKEGLVLFFFGIALLNIDRIRTHGWHWRPALWSALCLFGIFMTKQYIFLAFVPAMALLLWLRDEQSLRKEALRFGIVSLVIVLGAFSLGRISSSLNLPNIIAQKQQDFVNVAKGGIYLETREIVAYLPHSEKDVVIEQDSLRMIREGATFIYWQKGVAKRDTLEGTGDGSTLYTLAYENVPAGSRYTPPDLGDGWKGLFLAAPVAFFTTMLRPTPGGGDSMMVLGAGIENGFVIILIAIGMLFLLQHRPSKGRDLLWFTVLFTGILYILTGWVTPAEGALVRYKVPALPFLAYVIAIGWQNTRAARMLDNWIWKNKELPS